MSVVVERSYTLSKESCSSFPCSNSNRITKAYYNMLIGSITNGEIYASVCKVTNKTFGTETHYLISHY